MIINGTYNRRTFLDIRVCACYKGVHNGKKITELYHIVIENQQPRLNVNTQNKANIKTLRIQQKITLTKYVYILQQSNNIFIR